MGSKAAPFPPGMFPLFEIFLFSSERHFLCLSAAVFLFLFIPSLSLLYSSHNPLAASIVQGSEIDQPFHLEIVTSYCGDFSSLQDGCYRVIFAHVTCLDVSVFHKREKFLNFGSLLLPLPQYCYNIYY